MSCESPEEISRTIQKSMLPSQAKGCWNSPFGQTLVWLSATGLPCNWDSIIYIYIISTLACAVAQHCSLTFFPPACTCTRQTWFDEQGRNTSVAGSPMPHSWTFWPVTLKCGDYLQPEQWEQSPSRPVRTETRCKDKFSHGILGAIFPATSWNFVFRHAEQHCHREQRIL